MKVADTPVPARAGGDASAGPAATPAEAAFATAVAALQAGRDEVAEVRDDMEVEDWPAPKRLAPQAAAIAATAFRDGAEAGTARLMLLHDADGRGGWTGPFRVVIQVNADVDEEMAADPLLGEVGWSWLTDALDLHAPGYGAPSGTVTRVITEGYGAKQDEPQATAFELRASWCPADDQLDDELSGAVLAWADVLAAAAGLPSQPPGTRALAPRRTGGPASRRHR